MYLDYYHLARDPFSVSPDPDFLFLSPSHKEAIGSLLFCIENRLGFAVVTGEIGTGKTTVIRYYLASCNRENIVPVYIFNPELSFPAMLRTILMELGGHGHPKKDPDIFRAIQSVLLSTAKAGKTVVLLIDEAQNIPEKTLEQLRMLSNFETSREKLLQIILIGQPELEQKLEKHSLRQLKQRIATRAVIRPLTAEETRAYIEHRTDLAGGEAARLFTPGALQQLVRQAKGSPRTVNILCANALIAGVGYGRTRITKKIVKEVVRDLSGSAGPTFSGIRFTMAAAAVILLGMTVAYAVHSILVHPVAAVSEQEPHSGKSRESPEEISASAMIPRPGSPAPEKAPPPQKNAVVREDSTPAGPDIKGKPTTTETGSLRTAPARSEEKLTVSRQSAKQSEFRPTVRSSPAFITRQVRRGDYLTKMSLEVYGEATDRTLSRLQNANPQITDPDLIYEGDVLRFPRRKQ